MNILRLIESDTKLICVFISAWQQLLQFTGRATRRASKAIGRPGRQFQVQLNRDLCRIVVLRPIEYKVGSFDEKVLIFLPLGGV
jgi:hypothetical protein